MADLKRRRRLKSDPSVATELQKSLASSSGSPQKADQSSIFTKLGTGLPLVAGRLRFRYPEDSVMTECSAVTGIGVPENVDEIVDVESDAEFILLVEECGARRRLLNSMFSQRARCIIVSSCSSRPNKPTGLLLKKLHTVLKIPVLALVDCTPRGLAFLLAYGRGSENMYGTEDKKLDTPDIKWLGMRPTDFIKNETKLEKRGLKMKEEHLKMVNDMLEYECVKKNPLWVKELKLMLETGEVTLFQTMLTTHGSQYLTDVYLPEKLKKELNSSR